MHRAVRGSSMRLPSRRMWPVASAFVMCVLFTSACTREADGTGHESRAAKQGDAAPSIPNDSVAQIARVMFDAFLDASREGSLTAAAIDTLSRCDSENTTYFPTMMLAAYTIQQFEARGDTVVARASVITVAEQDVDRRGGGFVARQRVRTDVLEWDVYENEHGQWVVCNGIRFGYMGADSLTLWRPEGANYLRAKQQAESVWASRQGEGTGNTTATPATPRGQK